MSFLKEWINRVRYISCRSRFESELNDEVQFHLEARAEELQASGLPASEASAQARLEFGPVARANEDSRAAWQLNWVEDLASDLRYATRAFRRSPGFVLTAVLSLALGIGANTTIFSALYAVLWKPLPVSDPGSLVRFSIGSPGARKNPELPADFIRQLRASEIFAGISITSSDGLSFSYDDRAERIMGEVVSGDHFALLGVQPALGQAFTSEVRAGRWAPEAVLSYSFWRSRFGADPGVIGKTIRLNTYPFTIVGVSAPGFFGLAPGTDYELRIPILPDGRELVQIAQVSGRPDRELYALARLKPGALLAQSETAADMLFRDFLRRMPPGRSRMQASDRLQLVPVGRGDTGSLEQFHAPLYILLVLVAIVLLIACANVASMLLARATARAREFALRTSIGAGRFRLIRQMLAESLLLSLLGGALGMVAAYWGAGLLVRFLPQGHISLALDLRPDGNALIFAFALSLLTTALFGVAPAVHGTRCNLALTLKADSAASVGASQGATFRKCLVISQVGFSLLLLIAASVFVRTVFNLRPADYHVNPDRLLLFTLKPQREIYTTEQRRSIVNEVVRRVSMIPGVQSAAVAEYGPLGSRTSDGFIEAQQGQPVRAETDWVTPGFFDSAGIALVAGREFSAADNPSSPPVAIINRSLAQALFNGANPIGRTLQLVREEPSHRFQIVGIASDVHYYDIHATPRPTAWFAFQDFVPYMPTLQVRTARPDVAATTAAVRAQFNALDKDFPVFNVKTFEMRIEDALARERMVANLSGAFGVLALVLAAVGLYGILAYSVSRRTREIGIRVALGSTAHAVVWMVAREALLLVGIGTLAGTAVSVAAFSILSQKMAGVPSIDGLTLLACSATMLVLAGAAVSIPAIRACRVDPLIALRYE